MHSTASLLFNGTGFIFLKCKKILLKLAAKKWHLYSPIFFEKSWKTSQNYPKTADVTSKLKLTATRKAKLNIKKTAKNFTINSVPASRRDLISKCNHAKDVKTFAI